MIKPIVVVSGRPYHLDAEVNHGIDELICSHGAALVSEDSIAHLAGKQQVGVLNQWTCTAACAADGICHHPSRI